MGKLDVALSCHEEELRIIEHHLQPPHQLYVRYQHGDLLKSVVDDSNVHSTLYTMFNCMTNPFSFKKGSDLRHDCAELYISLTSLVQCS